ncbi:MULTISPECIES: ATP-binding cassette domain-containing protein [Methanobacterium]|jgi:ABC-2 type transport system ATP-binding protein|uniref:ATP-binding cassette domain-containing protein n=1 Tax=Methanobacterium veterum TaxID=408577 RepID=A0A9E5DJJ4_9EURY|nr:MULTISPECIES: ATP-binding cassette domain-containing protein [Methanobacterium]MCZ3366267.1 ATP-binding cassette domain-containing protein [Methanobacterium veterum]MCZ3371504.1 ATP-binding cassette domain-containing protein [Methanobacterium veterum]
MGNVIETTDITKRYDDFIAVNSINLEVPRNTVYGVLGPNGAGKTTLISMLCTILRPTSGTATVNGYDIVKQAKEVRESIGIVFQSRALDDILTGREHLEMHASLYGVPRDVREERIDEILELIALGKKVDEYIKTYSGGMKRRLEIGRGLIHHPKVLFLDEPTLGLDPQTRENIWEYIYNMTQTQDITVLLTTHYMEEADQLCDEVAIINKGEIITADSPSNLKRELKADTITLKVNDPEKFVEKANELKFTRDVFFTDGEVKMMVERGENLVPEVVEFASSHDIHINSIEVEHPNLEDVFIKYTGSKIVGEGR